MELIASVLGWSDETWTVVAALLAVVVAVVGVVVALRSHGTSKRAVAEAARSAAAAERSAVASEQSAALQDEALAIERKREQRERLESVKALGPAWAVSEDGEGGYFTSTANEMRGSLRNVGLMSAAVLGAYMDFDGQRAPVRMRCDGPQGGGGWASAVTVPPQSVLQLDCDLGGINLQGPSRPSLYIDYEQIGADTGTQGATVELHRKGNAPSGEDLWRVGQIRDGLLP